MTEEFERRAANGETLPDGLSAEDQLLYLSLRNLYSAYRMQTVNKEQASIEKRKLAAEHEKRTRIALSASRRNAHTVAMWNDISQYATDYRKDRTLASADKLLAAIEGKVYKWNTKEATNDRKAQGNDPRHGRERYECGCDCKENILRPLGNRL